MTSTIKLNCRHKLELPKRGEWARGLDLDRARPGWARGTCQECGHEQAVRVPPVAKGLGMQATFEEPGTRVSAMDWGQVRLTVADLRPERDTDSNHDGTMVTVRGQYNREPGWEGAEHTAPAFAYALRVDEGGWSAFGEIPAGLKQWEKLTEVLAVFGAGEAFGWTVEVLEAAGAVWVEPVGYSARQEVVRARVDAERAAKALAGEYLRWDDEVAIRRGVPHWRAAVRPEWLDVDWVARAERLQAEREARSEAARLQAERDEQEAADRAAAEAGEAEAAETEEEAAG